MLISRYGDNVNAVVHVDSAHFVFIKPCLCVFGVNSHMCPCPSMFSLSPTCQSPSMPSCPSSSLSWSSKIPVEYNCEPAVRENASSPAIKTWLGPLRGRFERVGKEDTGQEATTLTV